jgi:hypothetical protein
MAPDDQRQWQAADRGDQSGRGPVEPKRERREKPRSHGEMVDEEQRIEQQEPAPGH